MVCEVDNGAELKEQVKFQGPRELCLIRQNKFHECSHGDCDFMPPFNLSGWIGIGNGE